MTEQVLTDAFVSVGGVDLSDHVRQVTLNYSADTPEKTAMGDDTHLMIAGGLKNWTMDIEFNQDYAAAEVDATLFPLVGASAAIILRADNDAGVGVTNPNYTGTGIISAYQPLGGSVGDLHVSPVSIVAASTLLRATS